MDKQLLGCLQCEAPAEVTELYQGIPIRTCNVGHRTALLSGGEEAFLSSKKIALEKSSNF